ncbi:MAG TPA: hypothetical protein VKQ72_22255 [Aggregatilineales bacterium]|nr:hypothetical protein [Aggregatilineales bacterium]
MDLGNLLFDVIRVVHIVGAVFWLGFAAFSVLIVEPAIKAAGKQGGIILQGIFGNGRYGMIIAASGGLTVLAGIILYVWDMAKIPGFASTTSGIVFAIGGLFGIAGVIIGGAGAGRQANKMMALGKQIAAAGANPPAELMTQVAETQEKVFQFTRWAMGIIFVALLCMASARYL